jgi:hypothetical protein
MHPLVQLQAVGQLTMVLPAEALQCEGCFDITSPSDSWTFECCMGTLCLACVHTHLLTAATIQNYAECCMCGRTGEDVYEDQLAAANIQ